MRKLNYLWGFKYTADKTENIEQIKLLLVSRSEYSGKLKKHDRKQLLTVS